MNENYYKNQDYYYTEYAITLEDFYYTSNGKFAIPALFPTLPTNSAVKKTQTISPTYVTNAMTNNREKLAINSVTTQNYIELHVPKYIAKEYTDEHGYIHSGTKFIITFVGGDLNEPRIIGGI